MVDPAHSAKVWLDGKQAEPALVERVNEITEVGCSHRNPRSGHGIFPVQS